MRGPEEADVTPVDAELDAKFALAFLARTAGVSLFLGVRGGAAIGLPDPVATINTRLDRTVEMMVNALFEIWAAKAFLSRLFRGTPIMPAGRRPAILSLVRVELAGALRPMPSRTKQVAAKRRYFERHMDESSHGARS
jgi:hypothetical protein